MAAVGTDKGASTQDTAIEVYLRDGSTAMVSADFAANYPGLVPDADTLELLEANFGDEEIGLGLFKRVKVPSGEFDAWMITKGGESVAAKELTGVMVDWTKRRSLWVDEGEPDGSPPDCSSVDNKAPIPSGMFALDGERGEQNPGGKCLTCPMSKRGSSVRPGGGSACRQQMLFFLVIPGSTFPCVLHVPRTSITSAQQYMLDLMDAKVRYWQVEVGIALEKATNARGQKYNKIKFRTVRRLEPAEAQAAQVYGGQIKDMVTAFNASFIEMPTDDEGISVGDASTEG
jgi:hypothetical protein